MKKNILQITFLLLAFCTIISSVAPMTALAQNTQDQTSKINITPLTFNLSANPGDVLEQTLKIRNDSATTNTLRVNAENFTATDEEGTVGLTEEETPFSLAKWIKFKQSTYTLRSGQEAQVPFTITVPRDAEPGGHYASVYGQLSPDAGAIGSSGSSIGQKIGTLVLLRVAGNVKEDATVESFQTGQFQAGQPVPFEARVKNNGSIHIRPKGFVTITDIFGNKVVDVPITEKNVFPGSVRKLDISWEKPGFIGYYTANALMYYGQNNQQLTASTTFWIIPWMQLAIWGGVALVIVVVLILARKRIGKAIKALASGN